MRESHLTVCSPGPSLNFDGIPEHHAVACINVALKGAPRCDFWTCFDVPNRIHDIALQDFIRLRPAVVTCQERIVGWHDWFRDEGKLPVYSYPRIEVARWEPSWFKVLTRGAPRYSSIMVVVWAYQRRFTHVHFRGADMGGVGYFDEEATKRSRHRGSPDDVQAARWADRWKRERQAMFKLRDEMPARGLQILGLPD